MQPKKIPYHDLRAEALAGRLPELVGRENEMERLDRMLERRVSNNVSLVGPSGIGKTALAYGWMQRLARRERYASYAIVQIDTSHLLELDDANLEEHYREAVRGLPRGVFLIDDFGRAAYRNAALAQRAYRLYRHLLARRDSHLLITLETHEHAWLERECPAFARALESIALKAQPIAEYRRVLAGKIRRLGTLPIIVPDDALEETLAIAARFPALGCLPRSAISLLDESIALCALNGQKVLDAGSIAHVVEAKTGVPRAGLTRDSLRAAGKLEEALNARIAHQEAATAKIAAALRRGKLGLANPERPLASFLLLGPSGVGKTETAKVVAEIMFGRAESFLRLDMSEFQQEHAAQRLIGAPPGYVGHEEGGELVNAVRREPHSLLLLDEIEKAHPKVFDIFLQLLDDGRLTSGRGETVDAKNTIIMATSNAAAPEILAAHTRGADIHDPAFLQETIVPILARTFRLEFLNRFDAILVFRPLGVPALVRVAQLEIRKLEKRFAKHGVRFGIEPATLTERIRRLADPRFGARPIKRFIEETCETLLAQSLLAAHDRV